MKFFFWSVSKINKCFNPPLRFQNFEIMRLKNCLSKKLVYCQFFGHSVIARFFWRCSIHYFGVKFCGSVHNNTFIVVNEKKKLCSAKISQKWRSKAAEVVGHSKKKTFLPTSNTHIFQSVRSNLMKFLSHHLQ